MTKEQLNELAEIIQFDQYYKLEDIIKNENVKQCFFRAFTAEDPLHFNLIYEKEALDYVYRDFMEQIEDEDWFEYFYLLIQKNPCLKTLLKYMKNKENIRKCIDNSELIGIDYMAKLALIIAYSDLDEIEKYFSEDNEEEIKLTNIQKWELLKRSNNIELIEASILGKMNGINLSNKEKLILIIGTRNKEFIEKCINNLELRFSDEEKEFLMAPFNLSSQNIEITSEIKLPSKMTVGIEIESEGEMTLDIIRNFSFGDWKLKGEYSLVNGLEIISPIMHSTKKDTEEIFIVNKLLENLGQIASQRCGGHIHIGADYLTSKQSYANLMEIWCNVENILYVITNEIGTTPRKNVTEYAKVISPNAQRALKYGTLELKDEKDLDSFIMELKDLQGGDRESGINLLNINNAKNTIEFRIPNGTVNPEVWIENINLFGGIVAVSEELTQTKDDKKIEMFNRLKEAISNEEKLEILLYLIGVDSKIYKERYKINSELIKKEGMAWYFLAENEPVQITSKSMRQMSRNASALLQQEAMENITNEIERKGRNEKAYQK